MADSKHEYETITKNTQTQTKTKSISTMSSKYLDNMSLQLTIEKLNGKHYREWDQPVKLIINGK